jgi:hypothetical protein
LKTYKKEGVALNREEKRRKRIKAGHTGEFEGRRTRAKEMRRGGESSLIYNSCIRPWD